jgi:hypothetical protein
VVKVVICAQGIGVQIGLGVVTGCGKSGDMCSE